MPARRQETDRRRDDDAAVLWRGRFGGASASKRVRDLSPVDDLPVMQVFCQQPGAASGGATLHERGAAVRPGGRRRVVLSPDSTVPGYRPIELTPEQAGELRVLAKLVAILS